MISLSHGEHVQYIVRKHWFITSMKALGTSIFALLPLVGYGIIVGITDWTPSATIMTLLWLVYLGWVLVSWIGLFLFWTDYILDIWIITNKRIIDIEQKGLFRREVSSMRLENIQDITCELHGFIGTMLNFGSLYLQTSGIEREFIIPHAADANRAKAIIMHLHDQVLEEHETVRLSHHNIEQLRRAIDGDART